LGKKKKKGEPFLSLKGMGGRGLTMPGTTKGKGGYNKSPKEREGKDFNHKWGGY